MRIEPHEGPHTLREIGEIHELSPERVRRIGIEALEKLRAAFEANGFDAKAMRALFEVKPGAEERYLALVVERLAQYHGPRIAARKGNGR